jgi:hypothetical protein
MSSDRVRRDVLEATASDTTPHRARGARTRSVREPRRAEERVFRDIHGAEFQRPPNTVAVGSGGHAADGDDGLRRRWAVVCADRR